MHVLSNYNSSTLWNSSWSKKNWKEEQIKRKRKNTPKTRSIRVRFFVKNWILMLFLSKENKQTHSSMCWICGPRCSCRPHYFCCSISDPWWKACVLASNFRFVMISLEIWNWQIPLDRYTDKELPLHPCLKLISNSEQPLSAKWRRRLITMQKVVEYDKETHENFQVGIWFNVKFIRKVSRLKFLENFLRIAQMKRQSDQTK